MAQTTPAKILIVAPNAASRLGGEAFLPLKYFQILRRRGLPAKLIAHARNRPDLADCLAPFLDDIHFVEDSFWHRLIWHLGRPFPGRIREVVFGTLLHMVNERFQARIIRRLVAAGEVDLIHQPTPVSPLAPSAIHGFGVPAVIGPMNGGMTYPPGYDDHEGRSARTFVRLSRTLARLLNRLVPGKHRAAALLVANSRTRAALPVPDHPRIIEMAENGVDLTVWARGPGGSPCPASPVFRLVFIGRLVGWKAVDVTLAALRLARQGGAEVALDIVGDGPERARLEHLARDADLAGAVRFHGFLPQADCTRILAEADALILNSIRECGGAVVLEAMSLGLPVIGPDWGGPADYLDPSCGILVSPVPRESFAARLAAEILRLARDPALRRRMGRAGARKVRDRFDWEKKIDRMLEIYAEVLTAPARSAPQGRSPAPCPPNSLRSHAASASTS